MADSSGQWDFANAISLHRSADLVNNDLLHRANNDIAKSRAAKAAHSGGSGSGRGNGHTHTSGYHDKKKKRGGRKSTAPES